MSAPQYITKWLAETGGIAAVQGITPPASTAAYLEGLFRQGAAYLVQNDGWSGQPWASSLPRSP